MMYGNSSMGFSYSPDRSRDVSHDNLRSQFLYADGSRQGGYYYSPKGNESQGKGEWKQSGSGAWYKD
jgi:hypothetical protein